MSKPLFSVIIPAYNQADYLGEAIQSILDQTYKNYEIIIVNDASPDHTGEVVSRFNDPRIKYIVHNENRGLPASRNTGIRESSGQFIALLDADDLFLPRKLEKHKEFLDRFPEIGVSYNARFELAYSRNTIRDLWRPPVKVDLSDLVLGFPFSPSDMVIRREWAYKVDLFDESYLHFSEDLDINCRLALAGCKFAGIDKSLNSRRYYSLRKIKDLDERLNSALRAVDTTFADPRCPIGVKNLRDIAYVNNYLIWAYYALLQNETSLGQKYLREAIRLKSLILDGKPSELVKFFVDYSVQDENMDHELILRNFIEQFPPEFDSISQDFDWAVSRGYLIKGTNAIMWERNDVGHDYFVLAKKMGAQIDEEFLRVLTAKILNYEAEFGTEAAKDILRKLTSYFRMIGDTSSAKWLMGCYSFNRAIQYYQKGEYSKAPKAVIRAITYDPQYIKNRGAIAILVRSTVGRLKAMRREELCQVS